MVAVVVLTSLPPPATAQSDEEKARSQLQELQRDIKRINREIASASAQGTREGQTEAQSA